eukprot:COSAG06_NODE_2306_length_7110_cov_99.335188_12_plen_50_part_00
MEAEATAVEEATVVQVAAEAEQTEEVEVVEGHRRHFVRAAWTRWRCRHG